VSDEHYSEAEEHGMGWLPDLPDFRDYTVDTPEVRAIIAKVAPAAPAAKGGRRAAAAAPPATTDLRMFCSPIEDQGSLGSCTAQAGIGALEYFARRAYNRHEDLSRLFLYKVTRQMMGWTGDTGAFLRSTMGALAAFGAPPEKFWPYKIADYEKDPQAFVFAYAQNFKAVTYYRLDPPGVQGKPLLDTVKSQLVAGLPSMFGFSVYSSYTSAAGGAFPYPQAGEKQVGGHAVLAVGYDDNKSVSHPSGGTPTKGALRIRNSWGTGWGEAGYGWIPYKYVENGLASDFWVVVHGDFLNVAPFNA
jgi:C1A family cysteine protease